jgi:SAM-dependent methyltransferase
MTELITPGPELCGTVSGHVTTAPLVAPHDPMIERSRETWSAGDFGRIAAGYESGAAAFIDRLSLRKGEAVLDIACGTGNLTLPAARKGASVTGIDIAPNLIDAARRAAAVESLPIRFEVGAAEALPYPAHSFDTVVSMFGVMFSSRPELALSELLRVTRPGGRIALANWMPGGFVGSMLRMHTAYVPPPAGVPSPLAWGDPEAIRRMMKPHCERLRRPQLNPATIDFHFPLTPDGVVELFRECYGPSVRTFKALDAQRRAALFAELLALWEQRNSAPYGSTSVSAEYLEILINVA